MRRRFLLLMCPLLCLAAATPTTQPAPQVEQLISRLGDPDPAVRETATKELTNLGTPARSALIAASKSEDPEVAARASAILRQLPWFVAGDPPRVKEILREHSHRAPDDRPGTIHELLQLQGNIGFPAVLRLLENETDTQFRWAIVAIVRNQWSNPEANGGQADVDKRREACRKIKVERDDAPPLCLAAAAWAEKEPDRAAKLYRRAIYAADMQSTGDFGEIENAFDFVFANQMTAKQYADVADLLRRKAQRPDQRLVTGVPEPVAMLFMLHAKNGPLPGLGRDRRTFWQYQASPAVLYADSASLMRRGHRLAAEAVDRVAFGISALDPDSQVTLGRFLAGYGMGRAAARELERFLAHAPAPQSTEEKLEVANAQMMLAKVHARIANFGPAARALDAALTMLNAIPDISVTYNDGRDGPLKRGEEAMKHHLADMHGYYLQDAIERDDQAEIARRIKALHDLPMENPEIVQEVVLWLQNNGRRDEADYYFDAVEKMLTAELKKDPTANAKNSLAWFRARSHRKLDEALKLSQEAVAMEPTNAAYIDTLAECHFQLGKVEEAIDIERRALKADPGAPELESQFRRFLAGRQK